MHMVEIELAGNRFVQRLVMFFGIKLEPGHDCLIVVVGINAQPVGIFENHFETAVVRQIYPQWITEATEGEANMVVTSRLNGFLHDADGLECINDRGHGISHLS